MTDLQKEFKKYAREEFDCDVIEVPRDEADTFEKLFKADFMQLNKQVGSKMIKIKDNEKKEILEMAEEIAFSIVGDVADKEDAQSSIPLATALVNAHYRKQSETVKEFAEKVNVELNKLKILTESPLVSRTEKQRLIGEGMKQALLDAIEIINELSAQFGVKEVN